MIWTFSLEVPKVGDKRSLTLSHRRAILAAQRFSTLSQIVLISWHLTRRSIKVSSACSQRRSNSTTLLLRNRRGLSQMLPLILSSSHRSISRCFPMSTDAPEHATIIPSITEYQIINIWQIKLILKDFPYLLLLFISQLFRPSLSFVLACARISIFAH